MRDELKDKIIKLVTNGPYDNALDATIALIRAETLEEAAKVAEMSWYAPNVMYYSEEDERKANSCAFEAAAAIRALKGAP
jgi:hypothetical protein